MFMELASVGLQLYSAQQQKSASDRASRLAVEIGEENAVIIERDSAIADRQIEILQRTLKLSNRRKKQAFSAFQGTARAGFGGAGVELSRGAPITVAQKSAAEFEYELAIDKYNTSIAILEQEDRKEEAQMRAKVSRMGGRAEASAYKAAGTTALLQGVGTSLSMAQEYGMGDSSYWSKLAKSFSGEA
jgi:predicted HTH domain antitoxin